MAVNTRGPSPYLVTKQKLQNTYYLTWTLKRDSTDNRVTIYMPAVNGFVVIGGPEQPTLVTTRTNSEKFILGKVDGEQGFFIMTDKEAQPRRVIADDRRTGEGFDIHTADLRKGDPTQRWNFIKVT